MPAKSISTSQVMQAVQSLRQEVQLLNERVAALEAAAVPRDATHSDPFPEELLLTVSAAVAAYLGVQARIRQIRLHHSDTWAQQGRATIQASHSLAAKLF